MGQKRRVVIDDLDNYPGPVENPQESTEPSRLLKKYGGYTPNPGQALFDEPEAVSEEEQDWQTRAVREKRERVVMSPLYAIDADLEKLEATGRYKNGKLRFIRKLLHQLGEDAMRSAAEE